MPALVLVVAGWITVAAGVLTSVDAWWQWFHGPAYPHHPTHFDWAVFMTGLLAVLFGLLLSGVGEIIGRLQELCVRAAEAERRERALAPQERQRCPR